MGMWDIAPWDNDAAADWFGALFATPGLREQWLSAIESDPDDDVEVVRAAAWLFLQLGRNYVWPVDEFDADVERTIAALTGALDSDAAEELPELADAIRAELAEATSRRTA